MNEAGRKEQTSTAKAGPYAPPEQRRYADVLGAGVRVGFLLLVVSFALYVAGAQQPLVPVDQFVKATHTPTGWGWVTMLGKGDMLNLVGIAVLAAASAFSTVAVLPIFVRRREWPLLAIALLQLVVLALSASNLLAAR